MKQDTDVADLYLTRFAHLMRLVLRNSRSKLVTLDVELKAITLYVDIEKLRFDHGFNCEIVIDPGIDPEDTYIPPMLIQPYVENAIWHGLMHRKAPGELLISVMRKGEKVEILIQDNGVGRKRSAEIQKDTPLSKSYGTRITNDRIGLISRSLQIDASVQIEDLYDDSGVATGTRVVISLPNLNSAMAVRWLSEKE